MKELIKDFEKVELRQLAREKNRNVDAVVNVASAVSLADKRIVHVEYLPDHSIAIKAKVFATEEEAPS